MPLTARPFVAVASDAGIVASRGTGIASGNNDGDPFSGGLFPKRIVERVAGGQDEGFAQAVAFGENRGNVIVDDVHRGQIDAADDLSGIGLARLRCDEINVGAGRYGSGPLDVEIGFEFVTADETGIGTVHDDAKIGSIGHKRRAGGGRGGRGDGGVSGQAKHGAEIDDVLGIDVGLTDNGDGLSGAIVRFGAGSAVGDVIDGREVGGANSVGSAAGVGVGEERFSLARSDISLEETNFAGLRVFREIVELHGAGDDGSERCGNLRIAGVGEVFLAVDDVPVNIGVEGVAHLTHVAAELDDGAALGDIGDREALAREPVRDRLDVAVGRTVLLAKLIGSEPSMIVGGTLGVLAIDQLTQR